MNGPSNRLESDGRYTYQHDAEGNRIRREEIEGGSVAEYEWDHRNRLTEIRFYEPNTGSAAPQPIRTVSYEYDQAEIDGPPFSAPLGVVSELYEADFEVELLVEEDALWSHQGLEQRGLTWLKEFAVLLTRR